MGYYNKKGVIFDMDGTLLDTLEDIAITNNSALNEHGFPSHPTKAYRHFVGNGFKNLVKMSLPERNRNNSNSIEMVLKSFRAIYRDLWHVNTRPYPGIEGLLSLLEQKAVPKAVVTNKSQEFAELMIKEKLGAWSFDKVIGEIEGKLKKPDPAGVFEILKIWKIEPESVYFVGDSTVDMSTAKNSGTIPVAVSWGFDVPGLLMKSGGKYLLDIPEDLIQVMEL